MSRKNIEMAEKRKKYEAEAARVMARDETDGPALPIDDLRRRRWINDIVEAASTSAAPSLDESKGGFSRTALLAVVASIVLLTVGGIALFLTGQSESSAEKTPSSSTPIASRVVMITGDVSVMDKPISAAQSLHAGDQIRTKEGAAALQLAGRISVYIEGR